jgi:uncharacterized protein YhfF
VTAEPIDAFWSEARRHTRTDPLFADLAALDDEAPTPAASAFGATPAEADALLALVLDGTKTATAGALWDYEHEGETLPRVGDLAILLDGAQRPRGLIEVTQVQVVPYDEVTAEHARLEGEGDLSLAYWRDVHERFFAEVATHGRGFVPTMPVLIQRFRVLYSQ